MTRFRSLRGRFLIGALVVVGCGSSLRAVEITSVSPTEVSTAGGDAIRVVGSGFSSAVHRLVIGGVPCGDVEFQSERVIDARTPALPPGDHELWLEIIRSGEVVAMYGGAITAVAPDEGPRILSVQPDTLPVEGGEPITVFGENLTADFVLRIGGERVAEASLVGDRRITGLSPALPPGVYAASLWPARGNAPVARLEDAVRVVGLDACQAALSELRELSETPMRIRSYGPVPRFVTTRFAVEGRTRRERAADFLQRFGRRLYDLVGDRLELHVHRDVGPARAATEGDAGERVVYYQTCDGFPVHGAGIQVGLDGESVTYAAARLLPTRVIGDLQAGAEVSADEAEALALEALSALELDGNSPDLPSRVLGETRLVVFAMGLLLDSEELVPRLAWRVQLARGATWQFFVDAVNGEVLNANDMVQQGGGSLHQFDFDARDAWSTYRLPEHALLWPFLDPIATEGGILLAHASDADSIRAYLSVQDTFGFYHDKFGRHSFNGSGARIDFWIHSAFTNNASWNPSQGQFQFGTGVVSRDIVGHELTHAVIHYTSHLVYEFQSGALNESYADIMGESIDQVNGETSWLLGDNRVDGAAALRNMASPGINHISEADYQKECVPPASPIFCYYEDHGGVHSNSGIPNQTAFLMAEGGTHPDTNVDVMAMALAKMYRLKYAAMTSLPFFSGFAIAADVEIYLAEKWAQSGSYGFDQDDVCTVRNAWAAVGFGTVVSGCEQNPGSPPDPFDLDGDGVPFGVDNCPFVPNPGQEDSDLDNIGDACDNSIDADHDGFPDHEDTCPGKYNPDQGPCDDLDGDGVLNIDDNCVLTPNPGQQDSDADGFGDACQSDVDGDGVYHLTDNCPVTPNPGQEDTDKDGFGDACDLCPETPDPVWAFKPNGMPYQPDSDGDGTPDACDPSVVIGETPGGIDEMFPTGESRRAEIESRPGGVRRVPLPLPWALEESSPGTRLALTLDGLDPAVTAVVVNDEGVVVGPPSRRGGRHELRFEVRGGKRYALRVEFAPEHPAGDVTRFDLALFTQDELPLPPTFRRGDINGDNGVNVTDAVNLLGYLFRGGSELTCLDAADANDDSLVDVSDAVMVLFHLFREDVTLPDPGAQGCGFDPGETMGCQLQPGCE